MTLPPSSFLPRLPLKVLLLGVAVAVVVVDQDQAGLLLPINHHTSQVVLGQDRNYPASEEQKTWTSSSATRRSQLELDLGMAYTTLSDMAR